MKLAIGGVRVDANERQIWLPSQHKKQKVASILIFFKSYMSTDLVCSECSESYDFESVNKSGASSVHCGAIPRNCGHDQWISKFDPG